MAAAPEGPPPQPSDQTGGAGQPSAGSSQVVSPDLAMQLAIQPELPQRVLVTFAGAPGEAVMADLGLAELDPTTGVGTLDVASIQQVAARPDVLRVSWSAPPRLLGMD